MENNQTSTVRRLENARALQQEAGGQIGMIERTGRSQSQISQLMGDKASKPIGDSIARSLEEDFGKPKGWLDTDHPDSGLAKAQRGEVDEACYSAVPDTVKDFGGPKKLNDAPPADLTAFKGKLNQDQYHATIKSIADQASAKDAIEFAQYFLDRAKAQL